MRSVVALYAHKMSRDAKMTEARCHTFNRDVLLAVTSGRLVLCEGDEIRELAGGLSVQISTAEVAADLHGVREVVRQSVRAYLSEEKVGDLLTCVTEATTNALKYAGSASLETWIGTDAVSVVVSDSGAGIDPSLLARATLESGFSTTNTLGMGFTLMLAMADKIALHTSDHGTQVLIRINR